MFSYSLSISFKFACGVTLVLFSINSLTPYTYAVKCCNIFALGGAQGKWQSIETIKSRNNKINHRCCKLSNVFASGPSGPVELSSMLC